MHKVSWCTELDAQLQLTSDPKRKFDKEVLPEHVRLLKYDTIELYVYWQICSNMCLYR